MAMQMEFHDNLARFQTGEKMNDVARFTENLNFQPQSSMNNGSVPGSMDRSTNLLKANGQFGSISGIDQASMAEVSRITALQNMNGINVGNTSKGDVTNLMMYLQDGEEPGVYLHDMIIFNMNNLTR